MWLLGLAPGTVASGSLNPWVLVVSSAAVCRAGSSWLGGHTGAVLALGSPALLP